MQTLKERNDMFKFGAAEERSRSMVLNFSEFSMSKCGESPGSTDGRH